MALEPKYPDIEVELVGEDSNAYYILGKVSNALRRNNVPEETVSKFLSEAKSGDYDNLLMTCIEWVNIV